MILRGDLPRGSEPVTVGWVSEYGPIIVRELGEGPALYAGFLTGGAFSAPLERQGFVEASLLEHLINGLQAVIPNRSEHVLFVLGLVLLAAAWQPVIHQVAAFTTGFSVSIFATAFNTVAVPLDFVAPIIALSVLYIGLENLLTKDLSNFRLGAIFIFGLAHGVGLATDMGALSPDLVGTTIAVLAFIFGIELAQWAVILAAFFALTWAGQHAWYMARVSTPACLAIAAAGAFWSAQSLLL